LAKAELPASLGKHKAKYEKLRKEALAWQRSRTESARGEGRTCRADAVDRFCFASGGEALKPVADADPKR